MFGMTTVCLVASIGAQYYLTGDVPELTDWGQGMAMADDGIDPDLGADDGIFTIAVAISTADSLLPEIVDYKVRDDEDGWYGGAGGQNMQAVLSDSLDELVVTFDTNERPAWYPDAPWSISDDQLANGYTWVAVGDFQFECGESGDWFPESSVTELHDDGLDGDIEAGDGIYSYLCAPDVAVEGAAAKIVRQGPWGGAVKFGSDGWSFDPGDSDNVSFSAGPDTPVLFQFEPGLGWLSVASLEGGCDLTVALSDYPATVEQGGTVSYRAEAENGCELALEFDRAVMNITGPASLTQVLYDGRDLRVGAGNSIGSTVRLGVPPVAPIGTYTLEVTISRDGTDVSSDRFSLDVQ